MKDEIVTMTQCLLLWLPDSSILTFNIKHHKYLQPNLNHNPQSLSLVSLAVMFTGHMNSLIVLKRSCLNCFFFFYHQLFHLVYMYKHSYAACNHVGWLWTKWMEWLSIVMEIFIDTHDGQENILDINCSHLLLHFNMETVFVL